MSQRSYKSSYKILWDKYNNNNMLTEFYSNLYNYRELVELKVQDGCSIDDSVRILQAGETELQIRQFIEAGAHNLITDPLR